MFLCHWEFWRICWSCVTRPYTVLVCSVTATLLMWGRKCQRPALVCSEAFGTFLYKHCPMVVEHFRPTPWCWGGRLQTLANAFLKSRPTINYRNELIRTVDGGQISLDWVDNHSSTAYPESSTRPTVLFLPGLTGNSRQPYVLHAIRQAAIRGFRCVVFHYRGFGEEELLTPVTYCAASTSDLEYAVQHVKRLFPNSPLLGAGVSMGGIILLNYLTNKQADSGLEAGFTISVPWDVQKSCDSMEEPLNMLLFNRHLARGLCETVNRHRDVLQKVVDVDYVIKARSIREFDERFTTHLFGYESCAEYYRDASPAFKLHNTTVPILCLNAADDPFSPQHAFPLDMVKQLSNVALLVTAYGGHIAFMQGLFPRSEGYMEHLFGQFVQAVFEHPEDLKEACSIKEVLINS
ncbi:hypothetical protein NQD34_017871 [Periophthalmus magnuspinnatus]|nr:hypothetical protein NQD34_017871 [Periophthalmus magnuspinnatus]